MTKPLMLIQGNLMYLRNWYFIVTMALKDFDVEGLTVKATDQLILLAMLSNYVLLIHSLSVDM